MDDIEEKILKAVKPPQLMALATVTKEGKPWVRYVMGFGSEDFTLRVVTGLQSRKAAQIERNPEVHVICGASALESTDHYLQICARAEVTTAKKERDFCWNDNLKAYFSGPDDINYSIILIKPYRIEYWTMTDMTPQIWEAG